MLFIKHIDSFSRIKRSFVVSLFLFLCFSQELYASELTINKFSSLVFGSSLQQRQLLRRQHKRLLSIADRFQRLANRTALNSRFSHKAGVGELAHARTTAVSRRQEHICHFINGCVPSIGFPSDAVRRWVDVFSWPPFNRSSVEFRFRDNSLDVSEFL